MDCPILHRSGHFEDEVFTVLWLLLDDENRGDDDDGGDDDDDSDDMVMMGKRTARSFTEVAALKMHYPYKFEIQGLNRFNVTFSFLGRRRFNATFSSLVRC